MGHVSQLIDLQKIFGLADYSCKITHSLLLLLTEVILRIRILTNRKDGRAERLRADEGEVEHTCKCGMDVGGSGDEQNTSGAASVSPIRRMKVY